jgi:hypothetical protein
MNCFNGPVVYVGRLANSSVVQGTTSTCTGTESCVAGMCAQARQGVEWICFASQDPEEPAYSLPWYYFLLIALVLYSLITTITLLVWWWRALPRTPESTPIKGRYGSIVPE